MTQQTRTVEEILREVSDAAAALRWALDAGAVATDAMNGPDATVLSGLADAAGQLHDKTVAARRALSGEALNTPVRLPR